MNTLAWIVGSTFLISLIAWIGVLALFFRDELLDRALLLLVALAAGALFGGAFLHLLPSAIAEVGPNDTLSIFLVLTGGFCLFYVLEQFIHWHHHHRPATHHEPVTYLVLLSDTLHNFIDGLVIASGFVVGTPVGIVTALAIALHEIPQEIGDFGVLVYGGFARKRALAFNYATQSTVIVGGVVGFYFVGSMEAVAVYLLSFAAGTFIYISSSDLIPIIKAGNSNRSAFECFLVFLGGIGLMLAIRLGPHGLG